ncbi:MAG TPA: zinc-ribbon and DUF3426 domain-containing protein [Steroidobacteraceae bacterium]
MFTVCPKCALTLAVTTADLRIAQGYVRCGRCLNVFNALARLSEERPAVVPAPNASAPAAAAPDASAADAGAPAPDAGPADSSPGLSRQGADTASPQGASPPPEWAAPSTTADDTGEIEVELDASILVTSVQTPAAPERTAGAQTQMDTPVPADLVVGTSEPASAATSVTETDAHPPDAAVRPERDEGSGAAESASSEQTNTAQQNPDGAFALGMRRSRAGLGWKLGAGALAIALALQIINHYRDALAANPALSGPVTGVYSALGVKLAPRWNLHAYDVRQLGASMTGPAAGEIVVRASVKNSGSRAQPLPLLRVTLQDRFGNRIAARDVPPGDYLPSSVASTALLAAGSRVDATMVFVDPGPQAVGFEIDACLREQGGGVTCAHGP